MARAITQRDSYREARAHSSALGPAGAMMFLHTIPPWVRKLWLHGLIDLGLAELRNVRDSVALGS